MAGMGAHRKMAGAKRAAPAAVRSPALGRVIALASLRRECWEAGTRVRVASAGTTIEASVASFPFVGDDPTEPVSPAR